jgi:hypothetical protein
MARRLAIPSKAVELKIVGARDSLVIPRVQRLSVTADRPSTDIDELGNRLHSGTIEDIPAITVTFQAMDVGIKLFAILTGKDWAAYPASGVSITELTDSDIITHIKSDSVEDYVKMSHSRRCVIRDFTFTYTVDGESTEEYTMIGTQKRWFKNDVYVQKETTGTTTFTLTYTPVALKSGNKALSVILDGVYLTEKLTAGPATGEYYITGTTLTTGDTRASQLLVVYQIAPQAGMNWVDAVDATQPAAVRGMDVPVVIGAGGIERVQSITINGTFNPEAVKEMGNRDILGYQMQIPSVTGTITVLDTDVELIALLTTGQLNPSGVTEFGASEFTASGIKLLVKLYDPAVKTPPYPALKTLYMPAISITNEGFTSNVNQNAQQTFDFKSTTGEIKVYKGSGIFG